jgi:transcriptional regulator with PAS, ATPase and Fis domain
VERLVGTRTLRDVLYYRLNVMAVTVPPLRDRSEDIAPLAEYFRTHFMELYRREAPELSPALRNLLETYHWPGNVLEIENLMKRYVVLGDEDQLTAELRARSHTGGQRTLGRRTVPNSESLREVGRRAAHDAEMAVILQTLERVHWNRAEAARLLRVSYKTLLNKLNRAGISGRTRMPDLPQGPA